MENKKDIGKLFKDNLSQLDYSPSEMVWDKIETDLKKDKRKRRFFFWIFLFAILIIGTACYSYYHFNSIQTEKNNTKDNNTIYNSENSINSENVENPTNEIKTENKLNNSDSNTKANTNSNSNANSNKGQNNQLNNNKNSNTKYKTGFSNSNSSGKINSKLNSNFNESKIKTNKSNTKNKSSLSDVKSSGSKKYSVNKNNRDSKYNSSISDVKTGSSKKVSAHKNSRNSKNKGNNFSKSALQNSSSYISNASKKASKKNLSKNEIGKRGKKTKNSKTNKDNNLSQKKSKNYTTQINSSSTNNTSITNSGNTSNEVNQSNSATINITEIDSCCSDVDCIIPIEKVKKKLEKKKLPETKKDSVIIKPTKTIVFSPFAGYNNYNKLGTDNKYGNSELINNPVKYGNFFGLKVKLMFSEKTGIQSGVSVNTYYYNTTIKKLNGNLETESIVLNQEPSQVNATFINDDEVTFQNHLRYIEIPFEAYYYFNTRKLSHATSFGLSFYFPLKNQVNVYSNTVTRVNIGESDAYLKQGYGVNLNYYINYNITDKIQVFISPAAQFQFLGNFDYGQPTSYNFSISTGINYKL